MAEKESLRIPEGNSQEGTDEVDGNYKRGRNLHQFSTQTYKYPTFCYLCGDLLLGIYKQGVKCDICGVNSHKKCSRNFPSNCPLEKVAKTSSSALPSLRRSSSFSKSKPKHQTTITPSAPPAEEVSTDPKKQSESLIAVLNSKQQKEEELAAGLEVCNTIANLELGIKSKNRQVLTIREEIKRSQEQVDDLKRDPRYRDEHEMKTLRRELDEISDLEQSFKNVLHQDDLAAAHESFNCPICYKSPNQIFNCQSCENWICGNCVKQIEECPFCRQSTRSAPFQRNKTAERMFH